MFSKYSGRSAGPGRRQRGSRIRLPMRQMEPGSQNAPGQVGSSRDQPRRIQVARATQAACPAAVNSADPAVILRPSCARRQPTKMCRSPALTGAMWRAENRPSTNGGPSGAAFPRAPMPGPAKPIRQPEAPSGRPHHKRQRTPGTAVLSDHQLPSAQLNPARRSCRFDETSCGYPGGHQVDRRSPVATGRGLWSLALRQVAADS